MEEVMKILQNIQRELAEQKRDMKDMEKNIKESINKNIDEKFNRIETKTKELEQKIETQQKTIDFLDKKMRKKNIIFFGVPESEKNYEDLLTSILEIINNTMNITCPKWEIESVARLGKKSSRIRPVVITTTTTARKIQILKTKKSLENTGIYMKEDYPPAVLQKRKELQKELKRMQQSGEKVVLRYDKIVKLPSQEQNTCTPMGNTYKTKRFMSESPEAQNTEKTPTNEEQSKKALKKNKSQNITSFLRPSQLHITPQSSTDHEKSKN